MHNYVDSSKHEIILTSSYPSYCLREVVLFRFSAEFNKQKLRTDWKVYYIFIKPENILHIYWLLYLG